MSKMRSQKLRRKLVALCAAGTLFQSVQCTQTSEELVQSFVESVASVFITDYVNHVLGVNPLPF